MPESGRNAELRWVSVVFVDLVGSTAMAEGRDPEDVRAVLSGYFERARVVVDRYGGVIEKFIGDAVMAVWGSSVAHEDDAERGVRAALELVDAVAEYGSERHLPLLARAGVVTGEVATWQSTGEGLVVGDRVNTAARIQALAEPGQVLVDDLTKRSTDAAVAYQPAGEHTVKGKEESLVLWRPTRVVAVVGGAQRVDGLEARFVGRARELALVKELFHATVESGRARIVNVTGVAGVGKSRLGWEFEKYVDGIAASVFWHRGRCLSYGDGVSYWALAEMVRQRFDLAEEDPGTAVAARLAERLPGWVPDAAERQFVFDCLSVLLGGTDHSGLSKEELFAGWRLLLERIAAQGPVVMLVEDLHWADPALLDFFEQLLDWSSSSPLFVITLARPDLDQRAPGWLAELRNATRVHLDALSDECVETILDDLVPGIPAEARHKIVAQSQGVPLFAVETIRSLVDAEVVVPREGVYRLVRPLDDLAVPASLNALIGARLDGLPEPERELVKDLAVLGDTFSRSAVRAVTALSESDVDDRLRSLTRREVLTVRSDPLSPQRGHYAFVQTLLRTVAYARLGKQERLRRHLAVATHLRNAFPDDGEEVIEVIASHYQDAYAATAIDDPGRDGLRAEALAAFERAGDRASSLGALEAAERAYRTAASLTTAESDLARFTEAAARVALEAGRVDTSLELFEAAGRLHAEGDRGREAARMVCGVAESLGRLGRLEEAVEQARAAQAALEGGPADAVVAELAVVLATNLVFLGRAGEAAEPAELALDLTSALDLPDLQCRALTTRAWTLSVAGRITEAMAAARLAVDVARRHNLLPRESVARANLAELLLTDDRPGVEEELAASLALDRRLGSRYGEAWDASELALHKLWTGRWQEADELACGALRLTLAHQTERILRLRMVLLHVWQGDLDAARSHVAALDTLPETGEVQELVAAETGRAALALAEGRLQEALQHGSAATTTGLGLRSEGFRLAWPIALEAAVKSGALDKAQQLLTLVTERPKGHVPPYLRAQADRFEALLAIASGHRDEKVTERLHAAITIFGELGYPYWRATAAVDLARHLRELGEPEAAQELLEDAATVFAELGAQPALAETQTLLLAERRV